MASDGRLPPARLPFVPPPNASRKQHDGSHKSVPFGFVPHRLRDHLNDGLSDNEVIQTNVCTPPPPDTDDDEPLDFQSESETPKVSSWPDTDDGETPPVCSWPDTDDGESLEDFQTEAATHPAYSPTSCSPQVEPSFQPPTVSNQFQVRESATAPLAPGSKKVDHGLFNESFFSTTPAPPVGGFAPLPWQCQMQSVVKDASWRAAPRAMSDEALIPSPVHESVPMMTNWEERQQFTLQHWRVNDANSLHSAANEPVYASRDFNVSHAEPFYPVCSVKSKQVPSAELTHFELSGDRSSTFREQAQSPTAEESNVPSSWKPQGKSMKKSKTFQDGSELEPGRFTTVMIKRLPRAMVQSSLRKDLDETGFEGMYDFCYLPCDFKNVSGKEFAFVNFVTADHAADFMRAWSTRRYGLRSVEISEAVVQGYAANVAKWSGRASRIRNPEFRPYIRCRESVA